MPTKPSRRAKPRSVRQSVTIPPALAAEVRRVAKERHITVSHALVSLAERGIQAERDAKAALQEAYERFMGEQEYGSLIFRGIWQHLLDPVQEREISLTDLRRLEDWVKSEPYAPNGDWYKDFGSF